MQQIQTDPPNDRFLLGVFVYYRLARCRAFMMFLFKKKTSKLFEILKIV